MNRIAGLLFVCLAAPALTAQRTAVRPKPGVAGVQVPFGSLKPSTTFKIGRTADWVLVTDDAVWVASTKPYSVQRIDPATNTVVAKVRLSGEACSGLAFGFGSVWVPVCGKKPLLARVDALTNRITAMLPIAPAGPEGGITASSDSVWMVTDKEGTTLSRINPATNTVRQKISIPAGSYNPLSSGNMVWITGFARNVLIAVEASSGKVLAAIPVGSKPRFLTSGGGSVWTLNQGDGSVTRIDANNRKVTATIAVGIPGRGGDLGYGADSVWATTFDLPLTMIDGRTNKVLRQWVGRGGDSLRFGHDSIWLTDYHRGLLWRIPFKATLQP
jgi:virginiamycin B lyase